MKIKINDKRVLEIWFQYDSEIFALRKWLEKDEVGGDRKLIVHPFKDEDEYR